MLKMKGRITVRIAHGKFGPFSVGRLSTNYGDFGVKDSSLDQYQPGTYEGEFFVSRIYLHSYTLASGAVVTEIAADIAEYVLSNANEHDVLPEPEPDPAYPSNEPEVAKAVLPVAAMIGNDADATSASTSKPKPDAKPVSSVAPVNTDPVLTLAQFELGKEQAIALFGQEVVDCIITRQTVKLDPMVGRIKLREQGGFLKQLNYRFVATDQCWHLKD